MSLSGDLNSLYKVAYADKAQDLVPETGKLTKAIDFVPPKNRSGKNFELPVVLTQEAGFTYSLDTQVAYALNDSIGMDMQSAIVPGNDIVLGATVGYNQASRANSKNAFKPVLGTKLDNMLKSMTKRVEVGILYGNDCIGAAAAQAVATVDPLPIVIDTASWAAGIWAGSENSLVVFSKADATVVDSLLNFRVARVDVDNRTVYFAAGTGSLANLETAIEAGALKIHYFGSVTNASGSISYVEMAGLKKIITNTGTLFGISASTYDLWRGNTFSAGSAQLNQSKINAAISLAVQRGLMSDAQLWVNPDSWADLMSNQAAQRVFDSSYTSGEGKNGTKNLKFFSQNGAIEVVPYNLVKEGDAFIFPADKVTRVGSVDVGFANPARPSEDIFFDLPTNAGVGLRAYTNQAVFVEAPAECVYVSGIINS